MTQYNILNVTLSNSQLSKLKSAIKNETDVALRLLSNMIGNTDDKTNFKSVIKPLAKSALVPLGLTAAAAGADAGIHKKS